MEKVINKQIENDVSLLSPFIGNVNILQGRI